MRISLVEREAEEKKKRKRRKKRQGARSFDTAIAQPQVQARRRSRKDRAPARQGNSPRTKAGGIASKSRPRSENPAATAGTVQAGSRRRMVLVRLSAFLVLAGLVGLVVYGSTDAKFFVYQASVVGAHHIDATVIYQQASVDEQSIFWIRPEKVAERILQLDGIKAARVRCALPARVSIEVEEREPVLMWRALVQQRDWWLDEEGRVLPYPGDAESPEMIFVVDSSERQLEPRGRLQPAGLVHSVRQLAAALPGIQIFFYDADRELSFTQQVDGEQWPVYVGTGDDLPRKIQVLQVLTRHLQENKIRPRYVDVRWADYPVYSVPGGAAAGKGE